MRNSCLLVAVLAAVLLAAAHRAQAPLAPRSVTAAPLSTAQENVALGKRVAVVTNGTNDNRESPGLYPSDITDGSLDNLPSSWPEEDGTVGYINNDCGKRMVITATTDLQGEYDLSVTPSSNAVHRYTL